MRFLNTDKLLVVLAMLVTALTSKASAQSRTLAQTVAATKPAVVFIVSATSSGAKSGSGFVYSSNPSSSLIVTANHVVEGADSVDVIFDSNEHERYNARVVKRDHVKDVALLSVAVGNRPSLGMENAGDAQEGASIVLIGYPLATLRFERIEGDALRPSVHSGIVSAIRFNGDIVQFDAMTYHGDSGAPIIDASNGRVVAIVHGAELDPSYAARGLEQDLPGSSFGPSSTLIQSVVAGAASRGAASQSDADTSTPIPSASTVASATQNSSASYRVGYGVPHEVITAGSEEFGEQINAAVEASALDRLGDYLKADNSLYLVPVHLESDALSNAQHLSGYCDDNRLNTLIAPSYGWHLSGGPRYNGFGTVVGYQGMASVTIDLYVFDCYGDPFFVGHKAKSENRYFAHRTPDREIVDMSNDLLDQLMADFTEQKSLKSAAWDNLLKTGIAIDPRDTNFHSLLFVTKAPEGLKVISVVPNGPADQAGIRVQDVITRIDDVDASGLAPSDLSSRINKAEYTVVLERPGGPITVTVHPEHYNDIMNALRR